MRINRDRGITVVLAEHRTARIFAEADRVVVMEAGRIIVDGSPAGRRRGPGRLGALAAAAGDAGVRRRRARPELPLTVRDARALAAPAAPRRRELPGGAQRSSGSTR